jgi:hypothetical protein
LFVKKHIFLKKQQQQQQQPLSPELGMVAIKVNSCAIKWAREKLMLSVSVQQVTTLSYKNRCEYNKPFFFSFLFFLFKLFFSFFLFFLPME